MGEFDRIIEFAIRTDVELYTAMPTGWRKIKNLQEDAAPIKYLRLLLRYLEPEDKRSEWEKDVWKLENFGFEVRQNPIDVIRTIKFTGIIQFCIILIIKIHYINMFFYFI